MVAIAIASFAGEQPRVSPRLLPANAAQVAMNCRLDDGSLTPIREPELVTTLAITGPKTIYRHGGDWLAWDKRVSAAPGPVDDARLYITGDGAPKLRVGGVTYPLAMPRPAAPLAGVVSGAGAGDTVSRVYVYTNVSALGEESEPSPASPLVDWKPGQTVTLSGFSAPPAGRNITHQRIYRTQTGQLGTFLYFIAERTASGSDFFDDVAVDAFVEPLPSTDWTPPPEDLSGLVALPNGMMAGFSGRKIYFSEPFRPHAWPEKFSHTVDAEIIAVGALGLSLVVLTDRQPYIGSGSTPDAFTFQALTNNWPCINSAGVVNTGSYLCYPTHEGLAAIDAGGGSLLISEPLFTREAWQSLDPQTMVGGQLGGHYLGFYSATRDGIARAGTIDIVPGQTSSLTRTAVTATAVFYDVAEAALYYAPQGSSRILRFDSPTAPHADQYWRSKQFSLPAPHNFGAIKIDALNTVSEDELAAFAERVRTAVELNETLFLGELRGALGAAELDLFALNGDTLAPIPNSIKPVTVGVLADGVRIAEVSRMNTVVRLPGGHKAQLWEVDIAGSIGVLSVVLGTTVQDLAVS